MRTEYRPALAQRLRTLGLSSEEEEHPAEPHHSRTEVDLSGNVCQSLQSAQLPSYPSDSHSLGPEPVIE